MTYPQYPQNPAAQPSYPPAPPQQAYPPQPGYPPQQQYPQYPPQQGYPQAPAAPEEKATLADFWDQPAGGAKPLQWNTPGTTYQAVVSRPITDADTENQKDKQNQIRRFRDGSAMKVLKIPLLMNPTAEYPDGTASFYVKGSDTAELKRALGEAGMDPGKAPPMGTVITIQYTHDRPVPGGFNPAKVKRITLQRPQGMAPHGQEVPAPQANPTVNGATTMPTAAPAAASQYPTAPSPAPPAMPPSQPAPGPIAQGMADPAQQAQAQPPAPAQAPMATPPGMSPENAALLAQLTGQAPPQ